MISSFVMKRRNSSDAGGTAARCAYKRQDAEDAEQNRWARMQALINRDMVSCIRVFGRREEARPVKGRRSFLESSVPRIRSFIIDASLCGN